MHVLMISFDPALAAYAPQTIAQFQLWNHQSNGVASNDFYAVTQFDLRFFGRTEDGRTLRVRVTGDRDPGYGSAAKMLGEAAACLAVDVTRAQKGGGFWTPATVFDGPLMLAHGCIGAAKPLRHHGQL